MKKEKSTNPQRCTKSRRKKKLETFDSYIAQKEDMLKTITQQREDIASVSPEDERVAQLDARIAKVTKEKEFYKYNKWLYEDYIADDSISFQTYRKVVNQVRDEFNVMSNEIEEQVKEARRQLYYKEKYGEEWQEKMKTFDKSKPALTDKYASNSNEYMRAYYRKQKERREALARELKELKKYNSYSAKDKLSQLQEEYQTVESLKITAEESRIEKFLVEYPDFSPEMEKLFPFWERLDQCLKYASLVIPIYKEIMKDLGITVAGYDIYTFIPPFLSGLEDEELLNREGWYEFKQYIKEELKK